MSEDCASQAPILAAGMGRALANRWLGRGAATREPGPRGGLGRVPSRAPDVLPLAPT